GLEGNTGERDGARRYALGLPLEPSPEPLAILLVQCLRFEKCCKSQARPRGMAAVALQAGDYTALEVNDREAFGDVPLGHRKPMPHNHAVHRVSTSCAERNALSHVNGRYGDHGECHRRAVTPRAP